MNNHDVEAEKGQGYDYETSRTERVHSNGEPVLEGLAQPGDGVKRGLKSRHIQFLYATLVKTLQVA